MSEFQASSQDLAETMTAPPAKARSTFDPSNIRILGVSEVTSAPQMAALAFFVLTQIYFFRNSIDFELSYASVKSSEGATYFPGGPSAFEYILVAVIAAVGAAAILRTGFYRRWLFWRLEEHESRWKSVIATVIAVVILIELFAGVTALLVHQRVLEVSDFHHGYPPATFAKSAEEVKNNAELFKAVEDIYAWNFLDAIPALKVTETLSWDKPQHEFATTGGGTVLLLFKILVILPVINVLVQFFKRPKETPLGVA